MKTINLCKGESNGVDSACAMVASNMLVGRPKDGDTNSCVCRSLRAFIIKTNDSMPDDVRSELYGPLLPEILGTATNDVEILQKRAYMFADWAVREVSPVDFDAVGMTAQADKLRQLPEIVDKRTAKAAESAAIDAYTANAVADYAVHAAHAAIYAVHAVRDAVHAAHAAAHAANKAANVWHMCPDIIRRVAAVGEKQPVEMVMTLDELAEILDPT